MVIVMDGAVATGCSDRSPKASAMPLLSIVNDRVAVKFASQVLFEVPYMLAVPADHRFAQQQAVSVGELANEPLILPEYCGFLQDVTNALAPLGKSMRIVYRTDHDDRALALVAAGLGLALLPGQFSVHGTRPWRLPKGWPRMAARTG